MTGFGGEQGISFSSLLPAQSTENVITLEQSAHYTVRLYYTNEITSSNILYSSKTGFFREQTFTIDKYSLENITARNVTEITNSTNYKIVSTLSNFSTNQSIVFSWNEKTSGARTYAYYRYFPIIDEQYYSNRESVLSGTLDKMLNYQKDVSYLPVNSLLNLSTTNNNWLPYQGNTIDFSTSVSTEYVLSDAGLYLIDVYDEAGNLSEAAVITVRTEKASGSGSEGAGGTTGSPTVEAVQTGDAAPIVIMIIMAGAAGAVVMAMMSLRAKAARRARRRNRRTR